MKPYDPVTLRTPEEWLQTENWKGITILDTETTGLKGHCISLAYRHYEDGKKYSKTELSLLPSL